MADFCRLCGSNSNFTMTGLIMGKHMISYYDCPNCGYVQTEVPFWLVEAYENPINNFDTGLLTRNYQNSLLVYYLMGLIFGRKFKKIRHVDYAGGYGVLVGLLREFKIESYWHDKYCENLFAKGFNWNQDINEVDVVSAFEVFEHFENPMNEIATLITYSKNIIFTTQIIPDEIPRVGDWWYYGEAHGQHIGFYRQKTLEFVAKKYNLNLLTDGASIHMLTAEKISTAMFKILSKFSKSTIFNILKRI